MTDWVKMPIRVGEYIKKWGNFNLFSAGAIQLSVRVA